MELMKLIFKTGKTTQYIKETMMKIIWL